MSHTTASSVCRPPVRPSAVRALRPVARCPALAAKRNVSAVPITLDPLAPAQASHPPTVFCPTAPTAGSLRALLGNHCGASRQPADAGDGLPDGARPHGGALLPPPPLPAACHVCCGGTPHLRSSRCPPSCLQRYKQLLFYATKLEPFPVEQHNEANKVKGCVSQVRLSQRGLGAGL